MVAPFMGAWIETTTGLAMAFKILVAPFMGAWIETIIISKRGESCYGRTLHGCVD